MESNGLHSVRNVFGGLAERKKKEAVERLLAAPPRKANALLQLHDDLLFMRAFPGEVQTAQISTAALDEFERWLGRLPKSEIKTLDDSGVAGTTTRHVYEYPMGQWLARNASKDVDIDWRRYEDPTLLDPYIRAFTRKRELDAFDSGAYSTRDWVRLARGAHSFSDFNWLIRAATGADLKPSALDALWTAAEAPLEWRLKGSRWSTTRNFLPGYPIKARKNFRRPPEDVAQRISKPLTKIELLPRAKARRVIEVARTALAVRCREVVAITHANVDEVYWCDLGEGIALAVICVAPAHRLPLETNTGYLLFSNGVPIGYGGVTPLFRQANTGINIFDAFRGGEAAFLWVEMLRAFHSLFGATRFIVNGYQFGEGNDEAINSGAYWFYYRLGFRPDNAERTRLAAKEFDRLRQPGAPRSSKTTLKALAVGDMILDLPEFDARDAFGENQLVKLSALAGAKLAAAPARDRASAENWQAEALAKELGVRDWRSWPKPERDAFNALAPIVAIAPEISLWTAAEKRSVVAFMRAKGASHERDFAHASAKCPRLFRALASA